MSRLYEYVKPFYRLSLDEQKVLVEGIRKDRQTSKAILKKTTKKQRVSAANKLENMLAGMSDEDRAKLLKIMGA